MIGKFSVHTRREALTAIAVAGGATALGLPGIAAGRRTGHARDWEWLVGNWDVWNRRLKQRLAGSSEWEQFAGKSATWLTLDGLGTIDDNILALPGDNYRGAGIRAFDPGTGRWSIWWLDGRYPTRIDPPVAGGFAGDAGIFLGDDRLNGRPIKVRFHWQGIHGPRPHWQQSFSADGGATWEMNFENFFTRTSPTPRPLPRIAANAAPDDWDFLVGSWSVRHRRLKERLAGSTEWIQFGGRLVNWPILGGQGNVGDNLMEFPSGTYRGVGIRAFDPETGQWSSWWLDGRNPSAIAPPVRGGFVDGVGTFVGDDAHQGRPVKARVLWSRVTRTSARWEQAFSVDGGQTWETNWISDFTRKG